MAKSGSIKQYVTRDNYIYLQMDWSLKSQSVVNNASVIDWSLKLVSTHAQANIVSSQAKVLKITINGSQVRNTTVTVNLNGNQTRPLASGSTTISHNADGSKIFSYGFSQAFNITYNGYSVGTISGNGSGTLDTIPRATTPTLNPASPTLGSTVTISLPRASANFTHTLKYQIGSASGTIGTGLTTSASWTPPVTLANQIVNSTSGACVISCTTYNGSSVVGTKTITVTLKVPTTLTPSIASVTFTEQTPGLAAKFGAFIKDQSTVKASISASAQYGAAIKAYKTEFLGLLHTTQSFTTPVTQSGAIPCKVTVTDTRGLTATKTVTMNVLDYSAPAIQEFTAERCDANGTLNDEGSYVSLGLVLAISALENKNDKNYIVEYKTAQESTFKQLVSGSEYVVNKTVVPTQVFDPDNSYQLRLTVSDYFKSVSVLAEVPTAFTLMDFGQDGISMSLGKVSQGKPFEVALETSFTKNVTFKDDNNWTYLTLDPKFKPYTDIAANTPKYRIRGKVVEIRGAISPKVAYDSNYTKVPFATLPALITPSDNIYQLCVGANKDSWTLGVNTDGTLSVQQYGGTAYGTIGVNTRLLFQICYTID